MRLRRLIPFTILSAALSVGCADEADTDDTLANGGDADISGADTDPGEPPATFAAPRVGESWRRRFRPLSATPATPPCGAPPSLSV